MEKKENNRKDIVIGVLVAIIIVLAGLCVYFGVIRKDNVIDNSDLDISQISTKSFKVREFRPEKLDQIAKKKEFELIGENVATLLVTVNGNKAIINYKSNKKSITKEINDVNKVFYSSYGNCSPHVLVYILSVNKVYLIKIENYSYEGNLNDSNFIKEINNSNNYVDIYMDYLHPSTCDFIPLWLGRTADGKYYDLETSTEYKENTYFYYDNGNNYINKDKTYKLGNYSGTIKIGFIDIVSEKLDAYINEDNYLYEFDYGTYNDYKLVSSEKVVKVLKKEDKFSFVFANGSTYEFQFSNLEAYQ